MATALTIASTAIRQRDGLYSLNDLHKASGTDKTKKPYAWMRQKQAQELVDELNSTKGVNSRLLTHQTFAGVHGGTYACEELAVAYAAWISASFHLKVIRAFIDSHQPAASAATPAPKPEPEKPLFELIEADDGIPGDDETFTIVTTIEPGKLPRSQTYKGKVALMPCEAVVAFEAAMQRIQREQMKVQREQMAAVNNLLLAGITAKSTPANSALVNGGKEVQA